MESELKILLTGLEGVEEALTLGSQTCISVGTMKPDFVSFFQDEIKEKLKKDPELDSLSFLYLICTMEEKEVPRSKILEFVKEILKVRIGTDAQARDKFTQNMNQISEKYTNEWIKEYFSPKNKRSELDARTSWDENPQTAHCQKASQDIIDQLR